MSTLFASEYYREPGWDDAAAAAHLLPDTVLPSGLMVDEQREACRALKGSMLRKEVYGLDGTSEAVHPYLVTENNFTVEVEQRRGDNRHGVFFTHARETLSYQYERDPDDPRVAHALTLAVDPFGNVRRSLAVSYGRRPDRITLVGSDRDAQARLLATYTEADYTEPDPSVPADWVGAYRTPLPAETRTYEITGLSVAAGAVRLAFDELAAADAAALSTLNEVAYEQPAAPGVSAKRLIESVRTLHRSNDLTRLLPLGQHGSLGLPGETYRLGYTPGIVTNVYRRGAEALLTDPQLVLAGTGADGGGYVDLDADDSWWRPSGRSYFSPGVGDTAAQELAFARAHFFLAHRYVDPFGQPSVIGYDSDAVHPTRNNTLLLVRTQDPLGNTAEAVNDYRVLQPRAADRRERQPDRVAFDALGMVVGHRRHGQGRPARSRATRSTRSSPTCRRRDRRLLRGSRPARRWRPRPRHGDHPHRLRPRHVPPGAPSIVPARHTSRDLRRERSRRCMLDVRLLRRLRPGDPEEGPGRARSGAETCCRRQHRRRRLRAAGPRGRRWRSTLGRQRLDGVQQQGQAGPPVRAVLQRHPRLRFRRAIGVSPALSTTRRARRRHTAPDHTYERSSSTPGSRPPTT